MSEQPKALRLATLLEIDHRNKAAAELRRQHSRIAELEAELMEQARVNGMGGEREAKLMARVERLEAVVDVALEALEKSMYPQKAQLEAIAKLKEVRK